MVPNILRAGLPARGYTACLNSAMNDSQIHATAIVDPKAQLGAGVQVGPYAVIGAEVQLGDGCRVGHHATLEGPSKIGPRNEFFPYSAIGFKTHGAFFDKAVRQNLLGKIGRGEQHHGLPPGYYAFLALVIPLAILLGGLLGMVVPAVLSTRGN